jgi:Condensation domain
VASSALSPNEQWLWLVEQLTPGSVARTTATLGRRIRGPLDVDRLRACVTELIRRHETLRTSYVVRDGALERVVSDDPTPEWIWRDFSIEPDEEKVSLALRYMDEERTRNFDISGGKQTRCMVARISEQEHLMLFATHHIAADAASLVLMEEELAGLYAQGVPEAGDAPGELPYTRFVEWQAAGQGADPEESRRYWEEMTRDARHVDLDTVFGPKAAPAFAGFTQAVSPEGMADRQQVMLGLPLSAKVHELVRTSRASLFMVLLTALQVQLYLRSQQRGFLIRTPSSNRARPEHRTMVGALETHIFVKCRAETSVSFLDLLRDVRGQVMSGLRHHGVPLSLVLGSVLSRREAASRSAALAGGTVQFALFAHGRMSNWQPPLEVIVCAGSRIGTPADLQVFAMEEGRRLDGAAPGIVLEANNPGGAYTKESVFEFLRSMRDLIAAVADNPDITIGELNTEFRPGTGEPPGAGAAARPAGPAADVALEERLLGVARSALADGPVAADESLYRMPERAIDTGVRLLDAIRAAEGTGLTDVTLADLLDRPTVASLAGLAGER